MFCPSCGSTQDDQLKFCKSCGTNLLAVRQAVVTGEVNEKFDWKKTWIAEMFLTEQEQERRREEIDRQRGITPLLKQETQRHNEIKGGVITAFVGIALMIFLNIFFGGLIASGDLAHDAAEIVGKIWVVGVIPAFIGLGLIINGVIVSARLIEISRQEMQGKAPLRAIDAPGISMSDRSTSPTDWPERPAARTSVTENTTRELGEH